MKFVKWSMVPMLALALALVSCSKKDASGFEPVGVKSLSSMELDCGQNVKMKCVLIPKGKFLMGSTASEKGHVDKEGPTREVTLTKPFYMGIYEVTQRQYEAVMGVNPSHTKGPDNPVEFMSWDDAQKFCAKLSEKSGKTVRLPTEAEWEYACRAGTTTPWFWGSNPNDISHYAWYKGNAAGSSVSSPVGKKAPNPWGLYDMIGNVWELCFDGDSGNYNTNDVIDPTGNKDNPGIKVARGGSMNYDSDVCRAAYRLAEGTGITLFETGFRVVVEK